MKKRNAIAYKIYPKKTVNRIEKKMNYLGQDNKNSTFAFLNLRLLFSILLFGIFFSMKYGYILAPILTLLFYYALEKIVFDYPIKKRGLKLEEEAIFFFEILCLTLESNSNLKGALELTSKNIDSELSLEFKKALHEVRMGKSFTESLIALKERIPSDTINTIILNLTESSIFGNSVLSSLQNQLDYLREKRLLTIKAEIAKLPTKISVLSVLFFVPIMLLIILSPILLQFLAG